MNLKKNLLLFLLFFSLFPAAGLQAANTFDHSLWDAFLKKYVNEKGEVNYQAVVKDPKLLNDYWEHAFSEAEGKVQAGWSREEILAFWLNVYHAALIKQVVENYPVSSVQNIPGFWDVTLVHFGNDKGKETGDRNSNGNDKTKDLKPRYSLNDIRMKKLIQVFHDEKIHLILSQGARGGPQLKREAFNGLNVQGQIFQLTRKFVNDPVYVDVIPGRKKIRLSPVFKWYGKDFKLDFGVPEPLGKFSLADTAVISFLAYYLEDESKIEYLQGANYKIEYPPFDWSLNDWKEKTP